MTIKTDVVTSDIPLLLSLETMKKAGVKLDLVNNSAEIFGKHIPLSYTESGVVTSDIPLSLSLETMKKAGVKLDLFNDSAEIFRKHIPLNHTESGHYCTPLKTLFPLKQYGQ